ncbi:MAG: hypothetical protein Q9222_000184 [Ikaeria aurantiellina]
MSRYLTPSKIGLLLLINLYSSGVVPSSATVPILSFLVSYLLPSYSKCSQQEEDSWEQRFDLSIDVLQKATITYPSAIPGRTVWDLLLNKLWSIDSLDALHAFFDKLPLLLEKGVGTSSEETDDDEDAQSDRILFSRNSPFGAFIRRAQLEYMRLQFYDETSLWKSLITYRNPTLAFWKRRNPSAGPYSFDSNLQAPSVDVDGRIFGLIYNDLSHQPKQSTNDSTHDMERLLEHQIAQMQRMGNRVPKVMRLKLRATAKPGMTVPSASYYVQFLDAWKSGDYPSSFDSLHQYFDYTMQSRDRALYQYALLNLAILQADFGCFSEAITAIQETIATARENHDLPCLNYSLSWLYQFGRTHPEEMTEVQKKGIIGSEKEALSFLKSKAKESNMWTLLCSTLLSEAKLLLNSVRLDMIQ